jgi:hypothetical protein
MESLKIYGKRTVDGVVKTVEIAVMHDIEYHDEWMKECFVTGNVRSAEPIDWHFDDYVTYRGEVFSISYDPNVVKKARRGTYGEGFTYDSIRLYSLGCKTKNYGFKDVVLNPQAAGNTQVYTSLATFSFFCSSIEDFADRMQANLNRESQSSLVSSWKVLTPSFTRTTDRGVSITREQWEQYYTGDEPTGETDINIDIDKQNCFDVLSYSYEKFGLAYYMIGTTIVIGGKAVHLNTGAQNIFRYGKGLGLYEIERTSNDDQELVTKLFAYGSEKNLPMNYYANIGKSYFANVTSIVSTAVRLDLTTRNDAMFPNWTSGAPNVVTVKVGNDERTAYIMWSSEGECYMLDNMDVTGISTGTKIYFLTGIDRNLWPTDHTESTYAYPSMLSVNKLMLPGFPTTSLDAWVQAKVAEETDPDGEWHQFYDRYYFSTDSKDPWIKSKNIGEMGLFEGTVNYDGSQQKEIFPTIANTDADVVTVGSNITDNGYVTEADPFTIEVADGFDWDVAWKDAPDQDSIMISMTSGFCAGRDFKMVKAPERNEGDDGWVLTLERHLDNSLNRFFPYYDNSQNYYCQILATDTFVVSGIQMPDEYIEAAAEKMLIAACGYLDKRDHIRYTYLPKIDEIFMQRDHDERDTASYHDIIRAGMMLEFEDTDLGIWHSPFIDNLTIRESGNNGIPTYDVVLRDEKEKGTLEKIMDSIAELVANPPAQVVERQRNVLQYVEYSSWDPNGLYYYETLNTDTGILETSRVWHRGCLWECRRTLTSDEPWFDSADWVCLRANDISLGFYTVGNDPMPISGLSVRPASIDEYVQPYLLIGQEDISDTVTNWAWTRDSGDAAMDALWNGSHTGALMRTLHLTTEDFPSGWADNGGKVCFTCTATFTFENENVQISNQITVI